MAAGDIITFRQALVNFSKGVHDLDGDGLKLALVDSTITPSASTAGPHWGGTGTTDLSANEVSGTGYTAGGTNISGTITSTGSGPLFDGVDVTWALDAAGPTNARWAILYNDTDANKRCILAVDLGAVIDLTATSLTIRWDASGIALLSEG